MSLGRVLGKKNEKAQKPAVVSPAGEPRRTPLFLGGRKSQTALTQRFGGPGKGNSHRKGASRDHLMRPSPITNYIKGPFSTTIWEAETQGKGSYVDGKVPGLGRNSATSKKKKQKTCAAFLHRMRQDLFARKKGGLLVAGKVQKRKSQQGRTCPESERLQEKKSKGTERQRSLWENKRKTRRSTFIESERERFFTVGH